MVNFHLSLCVSQGCLRWIQQTAEHWAAHQPGLFVELGDAGGKWSRHRQRNRCALMAPNSFLVLPQKQNSAQQSLHCGPPAASSSEGSKRGFTAGCHQSLSNNSFKVLLCITFKRGLCSQADYEVPHLITQDGQPWAQRSKWFQYPQPAAPAPGRAGKPCHDQLHQQSPEQCSNAPPHPPAGRGWHKPQSTTTYLTDAVLSLNVFSTSNSLLNASQREWIALAPTGIRKDKTAVYNYSHAKGQRFHPQWCTFKLQGELIHASAERVAPNRVLHWWRQATCIHLF